MQMIPNTGIVVLNRLETAYSEAQNCYDQFELWFVAMSNSRGTVSPNRELDPSTMADCVSYLSNRLTAERAIPELQRHVESLKTYLKTVREKFEGDEVDKQSRQLMKVNYVAARIFVYEAESLIAKAEDHIERSAAINPELRKALDAAIVDVDNPETLRLLACRVRR